MKNIIFKISVLIILICSNNPIFNQEKYIIENDTFVFEEVVVVGQRYRNKLSKRPEAISLIKGHSIQHNSPMSMPDLMMNMPGVWMQKTNHGGGSPFIRGLTGYQTLIMVDGIRLNNAIFRSGPNQYLNTIDPLMIKRVEVLRGTGSVQYGSDAIGGTVYLITKDPEFSTNDIKLNGNAYMKWMGYDMEKTGRAEIGCSGKKITSSVGFTYKDFGDIHAGGELDRLNQTGYDEYSADFKSKLKLSSQQIITLAFQHHTQNDVPLYHKINPGTYSTYSFDPQQRDMVYLKLHSRSDSKLFKEITANVSFQQSLETRKKQKQGSFLSSKETDRINTYGFVLENISKFNGNWDITSGMEFYYDYVHSTGSVHDTETNEYSEIRGLYPDDSRMFNASLFSLHEYRLKRLTLNTGFRYNYLMLQVEDAMFGTSKIKPDALVAGFTSSYELLKNTYLSFIVNNAFRAPNINDVSSFGIADFRYEIPNFDLDPEKSFNTEIGLKTNQKQVYFSIHFYRNKLTDLIINQKTSYNGQDSIEGVKVYQRENANKALLQGIESELRVRLISDLFLNGNVTYTYGQNISLDGPMRRIPPMNGKIGLNYYISGKLSLKTGWYFATKQNRLSSGDIDDSRIADGGTPGWNTMNMLISYERNKLNINIGMINLFDKAYRLHGSGVDATGRNLWISVIYTI